jgi:FixJ family two-component response regulator
MQTTTPEMSDRAAMMPLGAMPYAPTPMVSLLDTDPQTRASVRALVQAAGLQVQEYGDVSAFLSAVAAERVGCIIVGISHGAAGVFALQHELQARGVRLPVIVAAGVTDVATAVSLLKAGAADVIESPRLSERLVPAVLQAITADLATRASRVAGDGIRMRYDRLTQREREVLRLVVEGYPSSAIAQQLGIQEKTVEIYRSHINKKMRARNAVELTKMMHNMSFGQEATPVLS